MRIMTYAKVLNIAQQLPPEDQMTLADTLSHNIRLKSAAQDTSGGEQELLPLVGSDGAELQALADAVVAADQQQIHALLDKQRQQPLTFEEQRELDYLLAETDQVALLKARALYTMKIFGTHTTSAV